MKIQSIEDLFYRPQRGSRFLVDTRNVLLEKLSFEESNSYNDAIDKTTILFSIKLFNEYDLLSFIESRVNNNQRREDELKFD